MSQPTPAPSLAEHLIERLRANQRERQALALERQEANQAMQQHQQQAEIWSTEYGETMRRLAERDAQLDGSDVTIRTALEAGAIPLPDDLKTTPTKESPGKNKAKPG